MSLARRPNPALQGMPGQAHSFELLSLGQPGTPELGTVGHDTEFEHTILLRINQHVALIGVALGAAGLAHVVLAHGRGSLPQLVWPVLTGFLPVVLANRRTSVSIRTGARIGATSGAWGGLVLFLLGTPLLFLVLPAPAGFAPGVIALLLAVSLLMIALLYLGIAAFTGTLTAALLGGLRLSRADAPGLSRSHFWRQFWTLYLAGTVGILSLLLVLPQMVQLRALPPAVTDLSPLALAVLSLINPLILLAPAVWVGIRTAPRIGFESHLATRAATGIWQWPRLRHEFPRAAAAGVVVSLLVVLLDAGYHVLWEVPQARAEQSWSVAYLVAGILYGGITEEILTRWGLLSAIVWVGWRTVQRASGKPRATIVWGAILITALIFGAGHLPVAAAIMPLTLPFALRTILLNTLGGAVFGWLYWKYSLEAAMVAHAAGHVVFAFAHLTSELFTRL